MTIGTTAGAAAIDVTVVMPCLNEADTLAACIRKAQAGLAAAGVRGEIVVADNGSTDGSPDIARDLGARVVPVAQRGYGMALMKGIEAADGRFIIMGDADDSYDFTEIPRFVEAWRAGAELVQGCRLPAGGGRVLPGAMPWSHRWIGNPLFTRLARWWFRSPIHDVYCGLRGFTPELYRRLDLRCAGMEYATEMIIKASLLGARVTEVPITLHPDGRKSHKPHLRTLRDGWRTLRFLLLFSPRWLFRVPGWCLIALGAAGYAVALPGLRVRGVTFDAHTLLFASLWIICGFQSLLFGTFARRYGRIIGLLPGEPPAAGRRTPTLERGLLLSSAAVLAGGLLLGWAMLYWWETGLGALDYARTMRWVIPGSTLTVLGFQGILASFFIGVLELKHR